MENTYCSVQPSLSYSVFVSDGFSGQLTVPLRKHTASMRIFLKYHVRNSI